EIVVALVRVVGDRIGLADAVGISEIARDQVFLFEALRITQCQRRFQQWAADRPPQIDDRIAVLQQRFGFLAHQVVHPLGRGPRGGGVVGGVGGYLEAWVGWGGGRGGLKRKNHGRSSKFRNGALRKGEGVRSPPREPLTPTLSTPAAPQR